MSGAGESDAGAQNDAPVPAPAAISTSMFAKPGMFGRVKDVKRPHISVLQKETEEKPLEAYVPKRKESIMRQTSFPELQAPIPARVKTYQGGFLDSVIPPMNFSTMSKAQEDDVGGEDNDEFVLNDSEVEDDGGMFQQPIMFDMEGFESLKEVAPPEKPAPIVGSQMADDFDEFDNCLGSSEVSDTGVGNEDLLKLLRFTPIADDDVSVASMEIRGKGEDDDKVSVAYSDGEVPPLRRAEIEQKLDTLEMSIGRAELEVALTQDYAKQMHMTKIQDRLETLQAILEEVETLRVHPVKLSDENQSVVDSIGAVFQEYMNMLAETYAMSKKIRQLEDGIMRLRQNNAILEERTTRDRGLELADMIHMLEDDLEMKRTQTSERVREMERDLAEQDGTIRAMLYEIETRKMERRRQRRLARRCMPGRFQK